MTLDTKPNLYYFDLAALEGLSCRLMSSFSMNEPYQAEERDADKVRWLISIAEYAKQVDAQNPSHK